MNAKVAVLMPDDTRLGTFEGVAPDGIEMYWVDSTQSLEKQAALLTDSLVVIAVPQLFPVELARLCPNLRLVQTVSAGVDMIDIPALGELGVRVANNGGGNAVAVAEHSIALILAVYRKLHLQFQSVKERKWAGAIGSGWRSSAHELTGKTVGILGAGPDRTRGGPTASGLGVRPGLPRLQSIPPKS